MLCSFAADFLFFWGIVFLVSTTLVAIFKRETLPSRGRRRVQEETQGVMETYKLLLSIIKMPTVFTFCALLLTAKVPDHSLRNLWFTFEDCRVASPSLNDAVLFVCLRSASLQQMQ